METINYSTRQSVISLFRLGHPFPVISSRTGVGKKAISKALAEAGINTLGKTFTVVSDPSHTYTPGESTFDQGNVVTGMWMGSWVPGMKFIERASGSTYQIATWVRQKWKERVVCQLLINDAEVLVPAKSRKLCKEERMGEIIQVKCANCDHHDPSVYFAPGFTTWLCEVCGVEVDLESLDVVKDLVDETEKPQ